MKPYKLSQFLKFRIALFIVMSLGVFSFSASVSHASGQDKLHSFTRVISYRELASLAPKKRADYIAGLRELFKDLDSSAKKSSSNASSEVREQLRSIASLLRAYDQFVATADAAVPSVNASKGVAAKPPGPGVVVPSEKFPTPVCTGNFRAVDLYNISGQNLLKNFVCVSNKVSKETTTDFFGNECPAWTTLVKKQGKGFICKQTRNVLQTQKTPCGGTEVPVRQDNDGAFLCASKSSFDALSVGSKFKLRFSTYLPSGVIGLARPRIVESVLGKGLYNYFRETGPTSAQLLADYKKSLSAADTRTRASAAKYGDDKWWADPNFFCPILPQYIPKEQIPPAVYVKSVKARCTAWLAGKPLPPLVAEKPAAPAVQPPAAASKPAEVAPSADPARRMTAGAGIDRVGSAKAKPRRNSQNSHAQARSSSVDEVEVALTAGSEVEGLEAAAETSATESAAGTVEIRRVADEAAGSETAVSVTLAQCSPESAIETCDAASTEDARRKYLSDSNPNCIYAGNVTKYDDGVKRMYRCEAPREFCFGSTGCKNDAGEKQKADYSCGAGQVICNPLLFGVKSDGKTPFCIPRQTTATSSCDELSKSEESVQPLDQDHPGIQEAWTDFADRLESVCRSNETAKILYCEECQVVKKRLFELNVAARETSTCGAALKFEASQCDDKGVCKGRPGAKPVVRPGTATAPAGAVSQTAPAPNDREPASNEPSRAPETQN